MRRDQRALCQAALQDRDAQLQAEQAKAVEFARALTASNPALFATDVAERLLQGGKQDDLADALILVLYYLDTYSNQLHK